MEWSKYLQVFSQNVSHLLMVVVVWLYKSWSNLFSRFYSEYKQRHKDEYQNDISQPYKYPGNWQVRILYHLLARGQTDTKAQAGHHDQHCFYLSWREIRWYSIQCSVFACSQIILQTLRREKRLSNVALHWSTLVSRGAAGIIIPLSVYPGQGFYRN